MRIYLLFQFCDIILASWHPPGPYLELGSYEGGEADALVPAGAVDDDGVAPREPLAAQQPQQGGVAQLVLWGG